MSIHTTAILVHLRYINVYLHFAPRLFPVLFGEPNHGYHVVVGPKSLSHKAQPLVKLHGVRARIQVQRSVSAHCSRHMGDELRGISSSLDGWMRENQLDVYKKFGGASH
jgi:hypothetical protein